MGFLDRFTAKKPDSTSKEAPPTSASADPATTNGGPSVKDRLTNARERLDAKDLPAAVTIYEELLATSGERADVLVTISGDLGAHGHVEEIVELIAPRYDAERHGPATGLNLLQAYLAIRDPDAAQHVLDILFALNRPELEDRLHGFSNAIAELLANPEQLAPEPGAGIVKTGTAKVALISISKPIWYYGLETLDAQLLPPKEGRLRRIAFAQLALPNAYPDPHEAITRPEDELGRLSRAVPLWFAEAFHFSANYDPVAAIGIITPPGETTRLMVFAAEWTAENLRQLVDTTQGGLDYIVTGALTVASGDYELNLRVFEVKTFRERKKFAVRWTPATADAELSRFHAEVRRFMEWSPASAALSYAPPAAPRAWLDTLGAALGLFLVEKSVVSAAALPPAETDLQHAAQQAETGEFASLGYLTLRARAARLGLETSPSDASLVRSPVVAKAREVLG